MLAWVGWWPLRDNYTHSLCCSRGWCSCWRPGSCCRGNGWCGSCCRTGCRWLGQPPDKAFRPAPGPARTPSGAAAETPSPGSGPAADVCTCTACSGTRFSPGLGWVWARRPGGLSQGRTGTFAAWSDAPARTPAPGRRVPGASCVAGPLAAPDLQTWYPPRTRMEDWNPLIIPQENNNNNNNNKFPNTRTRFRSINRFIFLLLRPWLVVQSPFITLEVEPFNFSQFKFNI